MTPDIDPRWLRSNSLPLLWVPAMSASVGDDVVASCRVRRSAKCTSDGRTRTEGWTPPATVSPVAPSVGCYERRQHRRRFLPPMDSFSGPRACLFLACVYFEDVYALKHKSSPFKGFLCQSRGVTLTGFRCQTGRQGLGSARVAWVRCAAGELSRSDGPSLPRRRPLARECRPLGAAESCATFMGWKHATLGRNIETRSLGMR